MSDMQGVRLDRWLWAARFFKTRRLAVEAINGGKVEVNGGRAKASKEVRIGFEVTVRKGPYEYQVVVTGLSERRGSAQQAAELYQEKPESIARREQLRAQLAVVPKPIMPEGRPDKKDRRRLASLKRGKF
ncbi:MAG: RNA-binding protein [Xanthomonadaceae bacterium]|nr:RNA-binding protein [Xanthomonadaceae bacterium]